MEDQNDSKAAIRECNTKDDFQELLDASVSKPIILFKHSTACGISAWALVQFTRFAEQNDRAEYCRVLIRENRNLSLFIAETTGIRHETPQVILFHDGRAVASLSHRDITKSALATMLNRFLDQRR